MPTLKQIDNQLHGLPENSNLYGGMGPKPSALTSPTITQVSFKPGELNKEELEHVRAVAVVSFIRLVWYVKEMRKTKCSYKSAVIKINKESGI